jgi:hypothetical protein
VPRVRIGASVGDGAGAEPTSEARASEARGGRVVLAYVVTLAGVLLAAAVVLTNTEERS